MMPLNVAPDSPPIYHDCRAKKASLKRMATVFLRNAEQLDASATQGIQEDGKTQATRFSSRKVFRRERITIRLQKVKHRLMIGFNSLRLSCHLYHGQQQQVRLNHSISASTRELEKLNDRLIRRETLDLNQENFYSRRDGGVAENSL